MRLDDEQESQNIEDRRGSRRARVAVGGGLGSIALVLIAMFFGIDPSTFLQGGDIQSSVQEQARQTQPGEIRDQGREFVSRILGSTEQVWGEIFHKAGRQYSDPKLVLFTGQVQSACGFAAAAAGPFYCGNDQKVYIDLAFYKELRDRFKAPGDFAQAYASPTKSVTMCKISSASWARSKRANSAPANGTPTRYRYAWNCKPTVSPASGQA